MQAGADEIKILRPCPALMEMQLMMLTSRSRAVVNIDRARAAIQAQNRAQMRRRVEPHNPAHTVLPDGGWRGEPCFILGGGPSLVGFNFERLRGRGRVIAINRAFEYALFADVLFFMDYKFYKMYHDGGVKKSLWDSFEGKRVFLNIMGRALDDVYSVKSLGRDGLSGSLKAGLYHGNNSGVGALAIALAMGAGPIYLLGYDMRHDGGRSHFHAGYGQKQPERIPQSFIGDFERSFKSLKGHGGIVNLNPKSALRMFPFGNIDEVLNGHKSESLGNDESAVREPVLLASPATN
ncbi:MAG: hypothetical protein IMZ46_02275 [Acidobacteria bacterium]|nr:hypothetical protein [Acidobacteriota bacterium]